MNSRSVTAVKSYRVPRNVRMQAVPGGRGRTVGSLGFEDVAPKRIPVR
jgi:hypothetical protein